MPIVSIRQPEIARTQSSWGEEDKKARKRGGSSTLMFLAMLAVVGFGVAVFTGKIDLKSLYGQSASATGAASDAPSAKGAKPSPSASATITIPPVASIMAPIASAAEAIGSALASAASSAAPSASAAPAGSAQDEADAGDDGGDDDDEEPSATPPSGTQSPRPVYTAHPSQPKHVQPKPRRPKRRHH
jgi:hypothetical protein